MPPDILAWLTIPMVAVFTILVVNAGQILRWRPLVGIYLVALGFAVVGIVLLALAKLPLYRQRRFFSFGSRFLDSPHRRLYRLAYGMVAASIVLLLLLILIS